MKFGITNPSSTELYRDRTAASMPLSLRRKRCYGVCAACVRLAATNVLKEAA
jgi:hypothetical protein